MSVSQARAIRRRAARRQAGHVHQALAFGVETAIRLNTASPIPGLGPVLFEIRADFGPACVVAICPECCIVEVLT